MITYDEAMERATSSAVFTDGKPVGAHWLAVAREIREAAKVGDPFSACQRPHFAVQDVEADFCVHDVIVVRLPGATEQWWHVAQKTWCTIDTIAPQRDRATPLVSQAADTAILTLNDTRPCFSCGLPIKQTHENQWMHVESARVACPAPVNGERQTYACPAAQR